MKKTLVAAAIAAVCLSLAGFAKEYEVKAVTGKVVMEQKGKNVPVKAGTTVSDETVVTLSTNSKLVLSAEGKDITLRTPKKATIAEQVETKMGISGSAAKKGKGTATASSRASDVMAEGELDD